MNDTSISIRSQVLISAFNSLNICGSCLAPVNREVSANEVWGRGILALAFTTRIVFCESKRVSSSSPFLSTKDSFNSSLFVSSWINFMILLARTIWRCNPVTLPSDSPESFADSRPWITISFRYPDKTVDASVWSMGSISLKRFSTCSSCFAKYSLMTCS